ncbi:MAG: hypothetical protein GXP37_10175 [Chloroflexi bacterium]|nr:hypothetical protein [Chloroflexota bacterium]
MIERAPNQFELSPEEQEMIDLLKKEMGLSSTEDVMQALMRQAVQRVSITCPNCGHYAHITKEDKAECSSCLSIITLSEDLWDASRLPKLK